MNNTHTHRHTLKLFTHKHKHTHFVIIHIKSLGNEINLFSCRDFICSFFLILRRYFQFESKQKMSDKCAHTSSIHSILELFISKSFNLKHIHSHTNTQTHRLPSLFEAHFEMNPKRIHQKCDKWINKSQVW